MSVIQRDNLVNKEHYIQGSDGMYKDYKVKHKELEEFYRTYTPGPDDKINPPETKIENSIWWTHILYDNAYEYITNNNIEKYTVVVPCYMKPQATNELTIKEIKKKAVFSVIKQNNDIEEYYNFCFVIAQSQEYLFKEALKDCTHTTYIALPDDQVQNIGMKRKAIVELFKTKKIFMVDDDTNCYKYDYLDYFTNKTTGKKYLKSKGTGNYARSLAVFQILAEETFNQDSKCCLCLPANNIALLNRRVCNDYKSATISGCPCQFFVVNCQRLIENDLNFRDSRVSGHEDLDLAIRMLQRNFVYRLIGCITFNVGVLIKPVMEQNNDHGYKNIVERFETHFKTMKSQYEGIEWVNFIREEKDPGNLFEGRGVPNTKLDIRKWKKLNNIVDTDYEHLDVCSKYVDLFIKNQ